MAAKIKLLKSESLKRILKNRNLMFLFSGQLISQMGDSMFLIGLMWLVLDLTGSKAAMGTVAFVAHIPNLAFAIFAGIVIDTFNRKRIMLAADFFRAVVVLIIPLTYMLDIINIPIIIAVAFTLSTFSTFFNPSRDSVIPVLVNKDDLLRANSLIQVSNYSAILFGPALAAALIGFIGLIHLFTIDSITFLLSLISILFIKYIPRERIKQNKQHVFFHLKEILSYIHQNKRIRFLLILTAVNNFFIMGPAIVGVPIFVKEVLNEGASSYAIVESSYGLGMLLGTVIINLLHKRITTGRLLLLGMIFDGVTYSVLYWTGSLELMIVLISFHAIGIPFIVVGRTSFVQKWVEDEKLGRVFSLVNMAVVGMTALTTGATGFLAEYIPIETIFLVFGIFGTLCGIVGWIYKDLREG